MTAFAITTNPVTYSILELVHGLCKSVFQHTMSCSDSTSLLSSFERPTKQTNWRERDHTETIKELTKLFFDVVILRRWEWHGLSGKVLDMSMTPSSSCMSFCYHLHCQGKNDEAVRLLKAVNSLTSENVPLIETEVILTFLALLARVKVDKKALMVHPTVGSTEFRYKSYSSPLFDALLHLNPFANLNEAFHKSTQLFECNPGTGFNSFLALPPGIEGKTSSLYDGLVHCTVADVNAHLGLPDLPSQQDDISLLTDMVSETDISQQSFDSASRRQSVSLISDQDSSGCGDWSLETRLELLSAINSDQPDAIREWEGWKESSKQYLCDDNETCFPHAKQLCLFRYCSMAGVDSSTVDKDYGFPTREITNHIDALPLSALQPLEEGGSVSRMFARTVQSLLDYFRAHLHQLAGDSTDLQLSTSAHWILPTVQFLMSFLTEVEAVPKGLVLLDALYTQACRLQGTPYYLVMLNLLSQSIAPYLRFVEQWVFQGWLVLGEEFGLNVNEEALARRDEHYWSEGYTLSLNGCAPNFFSGHAHIILTCGKALNLLRICQPSHPLCTGMFHPPKLHVVLSVDSLEQCSVVCQQYRNIVSENAVIREQILKEELHAREQELRAEVIKSRQEARAHAEKLRKLEEAYLMQAKEKKALFRKELLEQMKTNQALRLEQETEERSEDKKRQDFLTLKETIQSDKDAVLQQTVKEELIAYYAQLSREAELRQIRAEWRVQRFELSSKRLEMLKQEREKISDEVQMANKVPDRTSQRPFDDSVKLASKERFLLVPSESSSASEPKTDSSSSLSENHRRTWAESITERSEVNPEQPTRKTWIASMIDHQLPLKTINEQSCGTQIEPNDSAARTDNNYEANDLVSLAPTNKGVVSDVRKSTSFSSGPLLGSHGREAVRNDIVQDSSQTATCKDNILISSSLVCDQNMPAPSVAQELIYNRQTTDPETLSRLRQITSSSLRTNSTRGREQPSVAQEAMYPTDQVQPLLESEDGTPRLVSSRGCEASSVAQDLIYGGNGDELIKARFHSRGYERPSQAQNIIYGADWTSPKDLPRQEPDHPRLVSSRGHAPPSTVQLKMYPLRYIEQPPMVSSGEAPNRDEDILKFEYGPSSLFRDDFSVLGDVPSHDMLNAVLGPVEKTLSPDDIDPEFLSLYPISALMEQSVALPIITQSTLVNEALLRYFVSDCQINRHFIAMRWFLLLEDGEFGHVLSTRLCEELSCSRNWKRLCSSSFLNPIMTAALEVSLHSQCPEAQRISFALKFQPKSVDTHAIDALEFLQLKYNVEWPCNIVITNESMDRYNRVLQLLLQMKRASWALKNTFHQLKLCKEISPFQIRQLQVYRHEFQHFVNVMHGYITNQLFHLSWREFEVELKNEVHSLEELIQAHRNFVNKAIFRCLLSKKAIPVMKLIHNIFSSILKFSSQLNAESDDVQKSYLVMSDTHKRFREISGLLIKVVSKLVQRGYQPHLEDFLLRLNFNDFYT